LFDEAPAGGDAADGDLLDQKRPRFRARQRRERQAGERPVGAQENDPGAGNRLLHRLPHQPAELGGRSAVHRPRRLLLEGLAPRPDGFLDRLGAAQFCKDRRTAAAEDKGQQPALGPRRFAGAGQDVGVFEELDERDAFGQLPGDGGGIDASSPAEAVADPGQLRFQAFLALLQVVGVLAPGGALLRGRRRRLAGEGGPGGPQVGEQRGRRRFVAGQGFLGRSGVNQTFPGEDLVVQGCRRRPRLLPGGQPGVQRPAPLLGHPQPQAVAQGGEGSVEVFLIAGQGAGEPPGRLGIPAFLQVEKGQANQAAAGVGVVGPDFIRAEGVRLAIQTAGAGPVPSHRRCLRQAGQDARVLRGALAHARPKDVARPFEQVRGPVGVPRSQVRQGEVVQRHGVFGVALAHPPPGGAQGLVVQGPGPRQVSRRAGDDPEVVERRRQVGAAVAPGAALEPQRLLQELLRPHQVAGASGDVGQGLQGEDDGVVAFADGGPAQFQGLLQDSPGPRVVALVEGEGPEVVQAQPVVGVPGRQGFLAEGRRLFVQGAGASGEAHVAFDEGQRFEHLVVQSVAPGGPQGGSRPGVQPPRQGVVAAGERHVALAGPAVGRQGVVFSEGGREDAGRPVEQLAGAGLVSPQVVDFAQPHEEVGVGGVLISPERTRQRHGPSGDLLGLVPLRQPAELDDQGVQDDQVVLVLLAQRLAPRAEDAGRQRHGLLDLPLAKQVHHAPLRCLGLGQFLPPGAVEHGSRPGFLQVEPGFARAPVAGAGQ
jgi:hypothetical protein